MLWVTLSNLWGFVFTKDSISGINISVFRTVLKPFTLDVKTELAVERLALNQFARFCKIRHSLTFIKSVAFHLW